MGGAGGEEEESVREGGVGVQVSSRWVVASCIG